jgi:hypothetical protein
MLTRDQIDFADVIAEKALKKLVKLLEERDLMPQRYPDRMSTTQIMKCLVCSRVTVQRNWRLWKLKKLGRNSSREIVFDGLSVQRHIESLNR